MHDLPLGPQQPDDPCTGPPILAVLFDYGLVLSGPPDPPTWAHMLRLTGLNDSEFTRAYWAPRYDYDRGVYTGLQYWMKVGRYAGIELTPSQVEPLIEADVDLWTEPNQPMIDWALRLQAAGTRTGILSNLGDAMSLGLVRKLPWLAGFDHLTWSHTLKLAKPQARIYAHAAAGLGTPPRNILFVDDRADNIAGSLEGGMQAIRYEAHMHFEREMEERGFGVLWRTGKAALPSDH